MKVNINGYIIPNEYKPVYDFYGEESFCPNDIKIAKMNSTDEPLDITIGTCYGGSIFAGSEIGAEIASHESGSSGKITGLAASAAGVLAMYIQHLSIAPTAMIMVHNVSSAAEGDYHIMDTESTTLINCNKAMAAAYVMKSGMSEHDALKMMDEVTWLTAQQAKERRLVDDILFANLDPSQLVAAFGPGMIPGAVVKKTLAMLAEKKAGSGESKVSATQTGLNAQALAIARAKLNLIQKTMNF